jgi:hypothetical protein
VRHLFRPALVDSKIGDHLVNGFVVIGERIFHILDYLGPRNRRGGFREIHAGAMHDARRVRKAYLREGSFGCPQLRNRVLGKLAEEGSISRRGPELAYREQNPVRPGQFRRSGGRGGQDIEQFHTGGSFVSFPIRFVVFFRHRPALPFRYFLC